VGTNLSLNASPAFGLTEMTASSKLHDEAASATPAPRSRIEGIKERRNRIVEFNFGMSRSLESRSRVVSRSIREMCPTDDVSHDLSHLSLSFPGRYQISKLHFPGISQPGIE
jgi:hypothetical protein